MAHATTQDYEDYTGTTAPAGIGLMLTRASRVIDAALISAIYTTDDDGMATDPRVLAALRDATIEQAAAWVVGGEDGTGAAPIYDNVSIGSVTLGGRTGGTAGSAGTADGLASQARQVLAQAGLLGHPIRAC
ncbi:hypothetical protein AB0J63_17670 [Streptosporangium canum]|uniref:hypothetical protein n=1 Tax=Streptosporangium canum TaxID=324952 RepID=UPI00344A15AE